jgi:hypothetical protein
MDKPKEKLSASIMQQLEMQLSQKEIDELLSDGSAHTFTFLNAIFVDGQSLNSPAHQPVVYIREVTGSEEFHEAMNDIMGKLTEAYSSALKREAVGHFACARAGMIVAAEMSKGPEGCDEAQLMAAMRILGCGLGMAAAGSFDTVGLTDMEVAAEMQAFLDNNPIPVTYVNGLSDKGKGK